MEATVDKQGGRVSKFYGHGYISRNIYICAKNAPLFELTQKSVTWSWEARHQEAFNELKQRITNPPTLKFYDF